MIGAAIAVVTILDRVCTAVEQAARPGHSPVRRERATPTGTGFASAATSAGGHLKPPSAGGAAGGQQETAGLLTPGGHTGQEEPIRWVIDVDEFNIALVERLTAERDEARGNVIRAVEAIKVGEWLIAESREKYVRLCEKYSRLYYGD